MSHEIAQILRAARAKIEKPGRWMRGNYASDKTGSICDPTSKSAKCWCAVGALRAAAWKDGIDIWDTRYELVAARLRVVVPDKRQIHEFNDDLKTTHSDILALFDKAIAAEEAAS